MAEQVNDDEYKKRREVFHAKLLQFHRANKYSNTHNPHA
jgi:hypothetical protein